MSRFRSASFSCSGEVVICPHGVRPPFLSYHPRPSQIWQDTYRPSHIHTLPLTAEVAHAAKVGLLRSHPYRGPRCPLRRAGRAWCFLPVSLLSLPPSSTLLSLSLSLFIHTTSASQTHSADSPQLCIKAILVPARQVQPNKAPNPGIHPTKQLQYLE